MIAKHYTIIFYFFFLFPILVSAQDTENKGVYTFSDGSVRVYPKPKWKDMITNIPKDFIATSKSFISKENIWYTGGALATTALLVPIDQKIVDESRNIADNMGLSPDNKYGKLGFLKIVPQNIGSGFYFVGNGMTVILIGSGFAAYGLIENDYRAQATASGLMESMVVSGVFVQALKRITGRESPFIAIQNGNPGGHWTPFPSFHAYATETPSYDAMPSGHLTTIMSALTIITTNYPEYKWVKPVGYTLITGMCLQMMQSQVHWASDYPLALLIGYLSGKNIAKNRFQQSNPTGSLENTKNYTLNVTGNRINNFNLIGVSLTF